MDLRLREITPTQAATWLEKNLVNRKINKIHVTRLKESMLSGAWAENAEAIKFSKTGRLLDGQHRLSACVLADVPFKSVVAVGLEDYVFSTLDTGKVRGLGDNLVIKNEKYTTQLAAAVKVLEAYEQGSVHRSSNIYYKFGTNTSALKVLDSHPGIRDVVAAVYSSMPKPYRKSSVVFGVYVAGLVDPDKAAEFYTKLRTGAELKTNDPVLALRNRLSVVNDQVSNTVTKSAYILALVVKSINAHFYGTPVTQLRMGQNESCPNILHFKYGSKIDAGAALARTKRGLVLQ